MTVAAIKEKLHIYISEADDDKVKALYTLLEDQIAHYRSTDDNALSDVDFLKNYNDDLYEAEAEIKKEQFLFNNDMKNSSRNNSLNDSL